MPDLTFDSADLAATEDFLNSAYTKMSIGNDSPTGVRTRIRRDLLGPVSLDRLDLGFDMAYDADPLGKVCLVTVHTGTIEENYRDTGPDQFRPGETGLLTPPDLPYSGVVRSSRYDITMFDPSLLDRVTTAAGEPPVRLIGHRPVDAASGRHLGSVIAHLQQVAADTDLVDHPLLAATSADYLAATVLATMPTSARTDPDPVDRHDAHPDTVRRAIVYLESHLHEPITVADIAAAAFVTPRALQLAFRRHLDTTPLQHLAHLRLTCAHDDLRAATPGDGQTVTTIAYRWGFTNPSRFAKSYRRNYGRSPSETLHS
ncbi:helix-turn-helix transcriptional regulator [Nocardia takedensis]|uniref:helix-turn-helix transcriptional regulator n=1 Tax=Nocardia takedensis TaxID=259390 RepID=UPI00031F3225|nr:helix-turn-helix domain-containing protein [Nocardia takedensis]